MEPSLKTAKGKEELPTREEARKEWIAALRSGEYKQITGYLAARGGYCCLGVACHIFADRLELQRAEHLYPQGKTITFNESARTLPDSVIALLGLYSEGGSSSYESDRKSLVELNDNAGYTFAVIADALETGDYWKD
jgi:hypothetical protein